MLFMGTNEVAHLRSQHALHRPLLQPDDVDSTFLARNDAAASNPIKLAPITTAPRAIGQGNDRAGIGQRAQHVDMGLIHAGIGSRTGSAPVASSKRS